MNHADTNLSSPFLSLPDGIVIASVHSMANCLTVQVACCRSMAACPLCQQPAGQI